MSGANVRTEQTGPQIGFATQTPRILESWQSWPFQTLAMMTRVERVRLNFLTCSSQPDRGPFSFKPQIPARYPWRVSVDMCVCRHTCACRHTGLHMDMTTWVSQAKGSFNLFTTRGENTAKITWNTFALSDYLNWNQKISFKYEKHLCEKRAVKKNLNFQEKNSLMN